MTPSDGGMEELIPHQIVGTSPRDGRGGDFFHGLGIEGADAGMVLLPPRRGGVGIGIGSRAGHGGVVLVGKNGLG